MAKAFEPNLKTPAELHSKEELNKLASHGMQGDLYQEVRDEREDVSWETEQLAKSYGIYLEFNRAKTGREKDWMYMIRIGIPGGGPITPAQWAVLDDLAERYARDPEGRPTLRLTTRENIQFHWVLKRDLVDLVKTAAESGLLTLNGCGDNVRNVMSCPLTRFSKVFDVSRLAREAASYFRLPAGPFIQIFAVDPNALDDDGPSFSYGPQLLNRKFKMAFSSLHRDPVTGEVVPDNCVELLTHDLGVAPLWENGSVSRFQIYIGGGQGEKNGKPSAAMLALPLAIVDEAHLMPTLDAVVKVHQEWGDRQNRHWARLKYVVKKMGIPWFREQVAAYPGIVLQDPILDLDIGSRELHHGPHSQENNGKLAYGAFIENGRLIDDSLNGRLRTMVREVSQKYDSPLQVTPNQDIVFTEIPVSALSEFVADLASYGYGQRNGAAYSTLRMQSGACVGRDTCRLAYTDSERFEPGLIDDLEALGWGGLATSIGITGCERQCFRPATKALGLVGNGRDRYQLKILGTEDGRHQGLPVTADEQVYLKSVPRDRIPGLFDSLFRHYQDQGASDETFGYFLRRIGGEGVVAHLKADPKTLDLLEKPVPAEPALV